LIVDDLGGDAGTSGSAGFVLKANSTKYVRLDLSDSIFTSLENQAFSKDDFGCSNLISVIIPNSVTKVDNFAFYNCTSLASVTIGSSVTSIGSSAFQGCTSLTSITIPDSVTSIEGIAFGGCTNLTSVTFRGTITEENLAVLFKTIRRRLENKVPCRRQRNVYHNCASKQYFGVD